MKKLEVTRNMLLPTKGIGPQRALLTVGAAALSLLDTPATVSGLWERFSKSAKSSGTNANITFDWFAMALSMLFTVQAISWDQSGRLVKTHVSA
ncbi:ABC-three component system middle component 6 [Propionibacterium acidifaciens]|jgi:hypothetical protein|uniref:ABC-three component system middle component 6 n=1 Tax=Propionibacterium acidifaciens TaxID=556499 RepID=UPI0028DCCCA6|nr:ABC-three component system middle component 6 [Propionibacterium acidifaciens]